MAKSKGLGDTIEKVIQSIGIKTIIEVFDKSECNSCGKRKEKLNNKFPYTKIEIKE